MLFQFGRSQIDSCSIRRILGDCQESEIRSKKCQQRINWGRGPNGGATSIMVYIKNTSCLRLHIESMQTGFFFTTYRLFNTAQHTQKCDCLVCKIAFELTFRVWKRQQKNWNDQRLLCNYKPRQVHWINKFHVQSVFIFSRSITDSSIKKRCLLAILLSIIV